MAAIEDLRAHLIDRYDFRAERVFAFEDDVVLLRDRGGEAWIARTFGAQRSPELVRGDAAILAWLAERDYPAERLIGSVDDAVSAFGESTVLVTRAVTAVPRAQRRQTIKDAGGLRGLGELLGRLHSFDLDDEPVRRPGGAWHHMADGLPSAELDIAEEWLIDAQERAGVRELTHFGVLEDALEAVDRCDGLPEAMVHPDFVIANVVASSGPDGPVMTLVDWAGTGCGPRLWSLAWLLGVVGSQDLRRVNLTVMGYRRQVRLVPEERDRLVAVLGARALVLDIWRLHHHGIAVADAAAAVPRRRALAEAIAERARAAFDA